MAIGTTLRESRLRAGLTQAELANRSGTSQATLCAYERGHKTPTADTLERVLAATGHRLTTVSATRPVVTPSTEKLNRNAWILLQALELAAALPSRHRGRLDYPPLRKTGRGRGR